MPKMVNYFEYQLVEFFSAPGRRPTAIARARRARTQTRQIGSGAEKISLLDDISSQCPIVWGK